MKSRKKNLAPGADRTGAQPNESASRTASSDGEGLLNELVALLARVAAREAVAAQVDDEKQANSSEHASRATDATAPRIKPKPHATARGPPRRPRA